MTHINQYKNMNTQINKWKKYRKITYDENISNKQLWDKI